MYPSLITTHWAPPTLLKKAPLPSNTTTLNYAHIILITRELKLESSTLLHLLYMMNTLIETIINIAIIATK